MMARVGGQRGVRDQERPGSPRVLPERREPAPPRERADHQAPRAQPPRVEREAPEEEHQPHHAPGNHEAVPPEGDRGRHRQERQRDRAVEPRPPRALAPRRHARHHQVESGEGEREHGQAPAGWVVQDPPCGREVERRRSEDDERPAKSDCAGRPLVRPPAPSPRREGQEERGRPSEGDRQAVWPVPAVQPAPVEDLGPRECEQREPGPSLPGREQQHAEIEDGEVREERPGGVGVGVENDRREEPAESREDRQGPGVQPQRRRESHGRRDRQRHEGRRRSDEPVERVRGVQGKVDDPDADRNEALGRRAIRRAAREPDAARHHGQSEDEPREHAARGPDPLLLEGMLEEEADPEEEEDRSHAGEPRLAETPLPLPHARGGRRCRRGRGARHARRGRRRLARRHARRLEGRRRGGRGRDGRRLGRPRDLEDGFGRRGVRSRRRRRRRRGDGARDGCRRRNLARATSRVALQIEQAGLQPAHLAAEAQEHRARGRGR